MDGGFLVPVECCHPESPRNHQLTPQTIEHQLDMHKCDRRDPLSRSQANSYLKTQLILSEDAEAEPRSSDHENGNEAAVNENLPHVCYEVVGSIVESLHLHHDAEVVLLLVHQMMDMHLMDIHPVSALVDG